MAPRSTDKTTSAMSLGGNPHENNTAPTTQPSTATALRENAVFVIELGLQDPHTLKAAYFDALPLDGDHGVRAALVAIGGNDGVAFVNEVGSVPQIQKVFAKPRHVSFLQGVRWKIVGFRRTYRRGGVDTGFDSDERSWRVFDGGFKSVLTIVLPQRRRP